MAGEYCPVHCEHRRMQILMFGSTNKVHEITRKATMESGSCAKGVLLHYKIAPSRGQIGTAIACEFCQELADKAARRRDCMETDVHKQS